MNPILLILGLICFCLAYLGLTHNWAFTVDYIYVSLSFSAIGFGLAFLINGVVND